MVVLRSAMAVMVGMRMMMMMMLMMMMMMMMKMMKMMMVIMNADVSVLRLSVLKPSPTAVGSLL